MTTPRIILWVVSLAAISFFLAMNLGTVPIIRAEAGGMRIFDNRPTGYDFETAKQFLSQLSPDGYALYTGLQRKIDTLFPTLMAISLTWALWIMTDFLDKPYRIGICLAAFIGPMCDLTENHFVGQMLALGPEAITEDLVSTASTFSVTKWVLDILATSTFLLLGWQWLLQRSRRA